MLVIACWSATSTDEPSLGADKSFPFDCDQNRLRLDLIRLGSLDLRRVDGGRA
jgi:hypothetical protein